MKKLLAILLALALTFCMVACGEEETSNATASNADKTESTASQGESATTESNAETTSQTDSSSALLTPEEMFALIDGTTSSRLILSANFQSTLTMNVVIERSVGTYRISRNLTTPQQAESFEMFLVPEDGQLYSLTKDADGKWTSETAPEDAISSLGIDSIVPLFTASNYGNPDENGRYEMNPSFVYDFQNIDFGKGYLEQKNGTYTVVLYGTYEGVEGTLTLIIDGVDSTAVTLPQIG